MLLALQGKDKVHLQRFTSSPSYLYVCLLAPFLNPLWPEHESFAAALQKPWDAWSQKRKKPASSIQLHGGK